MTLSPVPEDPRDLGLPFDAWRKGQRETVQAVCEWYVDPHSTKFLFLEAPTGTGKSLLAGAVIAHLKACGESVRGLISTVSKSLQTQYADGTLPMANIAWGRGNHDCLVLPPGSDPSDAPCTYGFKCDVRDRCTYYVERDRAAIGDMAVLNTAFLLTCLRFVEPSYALAEQIPVDPYFSAPHKLFDGASLYIHDEAHLLEGAIRNSVEMKLYHSFFADAGFPLPRVADYGVWGDWLEEALPEVQAMADAYKREAQRAARQGQQPEGMALEKRAVGYASQLAMLAYTLLPMHPHIDLSMNQFISIRPIWGAPFAEQSLWRAAKKHILMSATIIHPNYLAQSLGIAAEDYKYVSLPSPFPISGRRVIDVAQQRITGKTTRDQFARLVEQMDEIIASRPEDKGIVHAVSYQRAKDVVALSSQRGRMITHGNGRGEKEAAIAAFIHAGPGTIFVSPSVGIGEDFGKDDGCRMQFMVKYPIPSIGDPIVQARMEDVPQCIYFEADMAFVQAVGRGMRTPSDYCDTYVLDSGARSRYGWLPQWFKEAIIRR